MKRWSFTLAPIMVYDGALGIKPRITPMNTDKGLKGMIPNRARPLSIRAIGVIRGFCFLAAMVAWNSARADSPLMLDAPESTRVARARFERDKTDLRELAIARAAAARGCYEARQREFVAGRGTLRFFLDASLRLLTAEAALEERSGARHGALERHWRCMYLAEAVLKAVMEKGRISVKDYTAVKEKRLQAEIWLAKARANHAPESARPLWTYLSGFADDPEIVTAEKDLAKARFRASEVDVRDLMRQRYETALFTLRARELEYVAGRATLEFVQDAALSLLDSEFDLDDRPADRLAALERYWELVKRAEETNRQRYQEGRIPIQDLFKSSYERIVAEIRLVRARAASGEVRENSRRPWMWWYKYLDFLDDPLPPKALAKARYAAARSDLQQLAR
jgi:hypothetical protein